MECKYQRQHCGGCTLLSVPYQKQLQQKQQRVEALLHSFCPVLPIIGMDQPFRYRNKAISTFTTGRNGKLQSGIYRSGSHSVVPVEHCLLQMDCLDATLDAVRQAARQCRLTAFDEDAGTGLLRHCLVRCDETGTHALVVIVTAGSIFPGSRNFVKALLAKAPWVVGVVQSINPRRTSAALGSAEKLLWGKPYLLEQICGRTFAFSAASFCQINPIQTEKLYRTALDFAGLNGTQTVLDAYCGVGTIGLCAASRAKQVIGVELNPAAARDAAANARRCHADNARFTCGDAPQWMLGQAAEGSRPDVVFLDPPRAGSTPEFIEAVGRMAPPTVVYVSCNPDTLARDLKLFCKVGYRAVKAQPVDMFPHTENTEVAVLLSQKV